MQKVIYNKITRKQIIKRIIKENPRYSQDTNFDRFDIVQLESIAKYGDERAERDGGYVDYDYGPTFITNTVTGKRVVLNQPLDPHFQEKQNLKIALQIAGSKTIRNVIKVKIYSDREKRILKIFNIFLNIDNGKYRRLLKTLEANLDEIAIAAGNNKGTKNLVKLIAACLIKNGSLFRIDVTTQDMEYEILKIGKELDLKGYRDFDRSNFNDFLKLAANMKFYKVKKKLFCEENGLFDKYKKPGKKNCCMKIPDRLITLDTSKFGAQRYVSELFNQGIVTESILINRLINDIDTHYKDFFKLNQNISKVTAVVAVRLFNNELKIPNLVKQILSFDNLSHDIELKNKIEGQCRLEERRSKFIDGSTLIKDHVKNGYIKRMYRFNNKNKDDFYCYDQTTIDDDPDLSSDVSSLEKEITNIYEVSLKRDNDDTPDKNPCPISFGKYGFSTKQYPICYHEATIPSNNSKYSCVAFFDKKDG